MSRDYVAVADYPSRRSCRGQSLSALRLVFDAGDVFGAGVLDAGHHGVFVVECGTPDGMKLSDLSSLVARREDGGLSYDRFRADPALASLPWGVSAGLGSSQRP